MRYLTENEIHRKTKLRKKLKTIKLASTTVSSFSLREQAPVPYDQGQLGSCTANAICAALEMMWEFKPSRLFLYYNELKMENQTRDVGADPWDGCLFMKTTGICSEATWPYDITKFNVPPPEAAYQEAADHKVTDISKISLSDIKTVISSGYPVLIAINIYESFESTTVQLTGNVPMPQPNEQMMGGHEVLLVGYDDATKLYLCLNSWGILWGDRGFFTLPYDYLSNYLYEAIIIGQADLPVRKFWCC